MQDIISLEKVGLTKNDRKVYLALLELGSATVSDLVKKTALHRSYIYDILDKLIDIGLISFTVKNNKKYFNSENPERILQVLKVKGQIIKESENEIKKILPELMRIQGIVIEKHEAKIFVGKEGIKNILEDILKVKKDFVVFGAEGKFKDIFKWYFDNWQARRVKLKLKHKIIYNAKLRENRPVKEQKLIEIKFLPDEYEFPATTIVYGNKVGIIIWNINSIAFIIESSEVAKSFLNYFNLLWKIAKE